MKKMLIVLAALTVMGAGFATAEDQKTEPKEPSTAYMYGYNQGVNGRDKTCEFKYGNSSKGSQKIKDIFDCNQGYRKGKDDAKEITEQSDEDKE